LPAVLVNNGSSLGGHEDESAKRDFQLLIMPVLPNMLRNDRVQVEAALSCDFVLGRKHVA
jgi:hypothetical protein